MTFKDYTEITGNIAQVLLAISGVGVFIQIKQGKEDLVTRSKREAASISADLAEHFRTEILKLMNEYYVEIKKRNYSITKVNLETLNLENFFAEEITNLNPEHKKFHDESIVFFQNNVDVFNQCQTIMNCLESFSINFTKGIADPETIFTATARTYCQFVERSFPVLFVYRHKGRYIQ